MKKLSRVFVVVIIGCMLWAVLSWAVRKTDAIIHPVEETEKITIDWAELYPFEDGQARMTADSRKPKDIFRRIYHYVKDKCEDYTSKKLMGYHSIVEAAKRYEDFAGWNIAPVFGYNPVVKISGNYLSTFTKSTDITHSAQSTIDFAEFCREQGAEFMYINLPMKICVSEDKDFSGVLDFSNQNATRFLRMIESAGVRCYDMRELLHSEGMSHHAAFFDTDHHWRPETGLWAARHILSFVGGNAEILNPENFDKVIYREWFLGSQGKKLTLSRCKPDDISLIYPKFTTHINFCDPIKGINTSGDFSVTYEMQHIASKDYYEKNPYAAYKYADQPLTAIHNYMNTDGKKILFLHDSFSNCVIPFVGLGVKDTHEIDLRHFTGSIKSYIRSYRPDFVIAMYHSGVPGGVDNIMYDFR